MAMLLSLHNCINNSLFDLESGRKSDFPKQKRSKDVMLAIEAFVYPRIQISDDKLWAMCSRAADDLSKSLVELLSEIKWVTAMRRIDIHNCYFASKSSHLERACTITQLLETDN